jgi:PAS domain S-box-containing protein
MFKLTGISIIIFIATSLNIFTAYTSWQRRKTKGGIYFALAMLSLTLWTLAAGLDYAAISIPAKVFFAQLEYLGYHSALVLLAMYTISYAGHDNWLKSTWVKAFLIIIPASNILLAWTNSLHKLLWTGFVPNELGNNVVIFEHGPAFIWTTVTGYMMIGLLAMNILQVALTGAGKSRGQARILFFALLIPVVSNLLYQFDVFNQPGVDWSSITFSITGLLFLTALYGSRFMEIVPTARNAMIEQMDDAVLVLDDHGRLVDFNPAAQVILGIGRDDLWNPFQATALARLPEVCALLTDEAEKVSQEINIGGKAFDIHLTSLEDQSGRMYAQLVVMRDISKRKRVEEALRESEKRFRQVAENASEWIWEVDQDGRYTYVSSGVTQILGYFPEEMVGRMYFYDLFDPRDRESLKQMALNAFARKESFKDFTNINFHKDGRQFILLTSGVPILDAQNNLIGYRGVDTDITQRNMAEEALRASEEKFNKAFHSGPDAIAITRMDNGQIMEVNDSFCRMFGYSHAEALSDSTINLSLWANPQDREEVVALLRGSGSVKGREYQVRTKSGRLLTGIYFGEVIMLNNEAHIISTIHDITQRKLAEKQLLEAQEQILSQHRELVKAEERQRIARNLHDSLSQSIHSLGLFSETLAVAIDKKDLERARRILERIQESAQQSHKETRLLLYELQNPHTERVTDLVQALEERLEKVERHAGIKVQFIQEGSQEYCPQEWYENLFWITIEALNNSLKHAFARRVQVRLHYSLQRMELEVSDNGKGFDVEEANTGGMGLDNLRTRASLIGGELTIESQPDKGTTVRFRADIPITI